MAIDRAPYNRQPRSRHEDPTTETPFAELTLRDFTAGLASRSAVPGGGSASAVAGALGASLLAMVAGLSLGRGAALESESVVSQILVAARGLAGSLLELATRDADAFSAVLVARRLPRTTDAERDRRAGEISRATLGATQVPLLIATEAAEVVTLTDRLAPLANPNAASDIAVARLLASASLRGALLNVRINLPGIGSDPAAMAAAERLAAEANALEARLGAAVGEVTPS